MSESGIGQSPCEGCQALGAKNGQRIPVWEDPDDYERGEEPDYIGCTSCGIMRSLCTESEQ